MTLTPEDILGQQPTKCKYCGSSEQLRPGLFACGHCRYCGALGTCAHSSMNPSKEKIETRIGQFLNGLMSKPNPPDKEVYIGENPPDNDAYVRGIIDRQAVVDIAKKLTNRVSEDLLKRICDAVFNDGIALEALQKIAAVTQDKETLQHVYDILDGAKLLNGRSVLVENAEATVVIARALIQYIHTHHEGIKDGSFKYERVTKTPFMAWRVKEEIQHQLRNSQPILVNPGGFDSKKQVDQFYANFNIADIILWNKDIWFAAIRGCTDAFMGTKVGEDIISSVTPMFWQFDTSFTLGDLGQYQMHNSNYDCVGFCLLPITEDFREVTFKDGLLKFPLGKPTDKQKEVLIEVEKGNPEVEKAWENGVKFSRYGISVAIVFMPWGNKDLPPEIRFMRPMFEGDEINDLLQATILAAAKFLTLKYVAKDNAQICKKELKQDRPLFKKFDKAKSKFLRLKSSIFVVQNVESRRKRKPNMQRNVTTNAGGQ